MNKTIIGLIIAGILLISIPVGVRLVQQQQILKSRATECIPEEYQQCGPQCPDQKYDDDHLVIVNRTCDADGNANYTCAYQGRIPGQCGVSGGGGGGGGGGLCLESEIQRARNGLAPFDSKWASASCLDIQTAINKDTKLFEGDSIRTTFASCTCPASGGGGGGGGGGGTGGGGNCLDRTTPPGGNPTQCPTISWAQIWNDMKKAGYGWSPADTCSPSEVIAKYAAMPAHQSVCQGGGGACNIGSQTPSLTDDQVSCIIRIRGAGHPDNIKKAINSDTSSLTSCSNKQLINFWCNGGISPEASSQCSDDKKVCGAVGGPGPSGAGLSCAVSGDLTITRGSKPTFIAKPTSSLVKSLELSYNFGDKYNKDDWRVLNSCSAGLVEGCQGEIDASLDKIPESVKQFIVKCDGFSTLKGAARIYSPSTSCSGNPVIGTNIGDTNSDYPDWSYCGPASNKTVTLKAAVAPTAAPTFTPAPSPVPTACKAQVRLSADGNQPWNTSLPITLGAPVYLAGFDGDQTEAASADITDIQIKGPSNSPTVSSHTVTLPVSAKNEKNIFSYTIPANDGAGTYIITVRRNGVDCIGKANLTVTAPVATTARYRVSENKADFTLADSAIAPWVPYTTDGILANYLIRDRNPGQKLIYVEFEDSNGFRGGCGSNNKLTTSTKLEDKKYPCMMPIKYLDSGRISNCSISIDGSNTILNLTGDNFGTAQGSVKGTIIAGSTEGTGLSPITWEDNLVSVKWSNAPQGKNLYVTLTTANKQKMPGTCSPVSQLALSTKVFCQAISTTNCAKGNVNLAIKDVASGDIVVNKTVSINTDGVVTGLNQKLEAGKKYILSIKAPKSLRRNREFTVTTATGGTTNISDFVLPLGDINTLGGQGDGKIAGSDYALMVRDWNISTDTGDRAGDVDCNRRVNSRDWACLVYDYGKESDPELVPGVELTNPNATPVPGTTGTPAPGQPGACTLGMYVRFEGINNAAFSAHPVVTLGLYPPGATIRPGTIPPAEPLGYNLSSGTVAVTSSTVPTHQQDVFLITSGTKQLTCGESYDVVVMSSGYKLSRFRGVKVVNNPSLYPTFFFNNEPICKKTAGGCNYKCLENDPCCPFTTGSPIPANNCVVQ